MQSVLWVAKGSKKDVSQWVQAIQPNLLKLRVDEEEIDEDCISLTRRSLYADEKVNQMNGDIP